MTGAFGVAIAQLSGQRDSVTITSVSPTGALTRGVPVTVTVAVDAELVFVNDLMNGASGDVARHKISVLWIPLFEKIETVSLGNGARIALVM